jgi:two-component system nitrate/nitrite response regulator NarL
MEYTMISTLTVATHPCGIFRDGLRQTLAKSRFRPVRLLPSVSDDIERHLPSAEGCIWLFGVDKFNPDAERLVRKVRASNSAVRVVVLAASQDAADIVRALNVGVSGFLCQDIPGDQLLRSLDLIVLGETVIYPHFWQMPLSELGSQAEADGGMRVGDAANRAGHLPTRLGSETAGGLAGEEATSESSAGGLSRREILILRTLMDGASNKVIARKLVITESTVKVHMKAILRKLRLKNRTQAALWARSYLSEISP